MWNWSLVNAAELHSWYVNIGSGDGLGLSGNNPLLEPMLTQVCIAIWRHIFVNTGNPYT